MVHISKLFEIAETKPDFSITWVAESGEVVHIDHARCTSFHASGDTMNVQCLASGEIRKVNRYTITEFCGEEVIL